MASPLPGNLSQWKARVRKIQSFDGDIHSLQKYDSGSKIGLKQLLSLRVFWKEKTLAQFHGAAYVRQECLDKAVAYLDASGDFQRYLGQIRADRKYAPPFPAVGLFSQELASQLEIGRVPENYNKAEPDSAKVCDVDPVAARTRGKLAALRAQGAQGSRSAAAVAAGGMGGAMEDLQLSGEDAYAASTGSGAIIEDETSYLDRAPVPATPGYYEPGGKVANDEQTVNTALYLFLNATIMHHAKVRAYWTMHRIGFQIHTYFEARTDGYLEGLGSYRVCAILEVKRYRRASNANAVRMQETAQMAAWIADRPQDCFTLSNTKDARQKCRLLISQDNDEVYLTFAVYSAAYEKYLHDKEPDRQRAGVDAASFLTMHQYGPWILTDTIFVRELAIFVLAFVIMQSMTTAAVPFPLRA